MDAAHLVLQPISKPPKLLDQVRRCIHDKHYNLRTEEAYADWTRWYIRFHGLRHPMDMGAAEIKAFLSYLTNERPVSVSLTGWSGPNRDFPSPPSAKSRLHLLVKALSFTFPPQTKRRTHEHRK